MSKKNTPSKFAKMLGKKLKTARGERTFDQVAAATNGFVHPRMLINYENGTELRLSTFLVLAVALGYNPLDLLPPDVTLACEERNLNALIPLVTL